MKYFKSFLFVSFIFSILYFIFGSALLTHAQTDVHVNGDVPSRVNPTHSSFKADRSSLLADGVEKVTLTATVVDVNNDPLADKLVVVTSSRGQTVDSIRCYFGIVLTYQNQTTTDANGRAICEVTSNTEGVTTFTAVAEGITLSDKPEVTFNKVIQPEPNPTPQPGPTPTPQPEPSPTVTPPVTQPPGIIQKIIERTNEFLKNIPPILPGGIGLAILLPTIGLLMPLGSGISASVTAGIPAFQYLLFNALPSFRAPKRWGKVRDHQTKVPLPGIFVLLVDVATTQVVKKVMTDRAGRYGFLDPKAGNYRVEVHGPLYGAYVSDPFNANIFSGHSVSFDIELNPISEARVGAMHRTVSYMRFLAAVQAIQYVLIIGGSILAVGMFISNQSPENVLLLSIYALLWVLHFISSLSYTQSGHITERQADNAINEAVVQVTSVKKGEQQFIHSTVTDESGRFLILVPPGQYTVFAAKDGYNPAERVVSGEIQNVEISLDRLGDATPTP